MALVIFQFSLKFAIVAGKSLDMIISCGNLFFNICLKLFKFLCFFFNYILFFVVNFNPLGNSLFLNHNFLFKFSDGLILLIKLILKILYAIKVFFELSELPQFMILYNKFIIQLFNMLLFGCDFIFQINKYCGRLTLKFTCWFRLFVNNSRGWWLLSWSSRFALLNQITFTLKLIV